MLLFCSRYSLYDLDLFLIIKGYLEEKVDLFILNIYGYVKFFRSERNLVKLLYGWEFFSIRVLVYSVFLIIL